MKKIRSFKHYFYLGACMAFFFTLTLPPDAAFAQDFSQEMASVESIERSHDIRWVYKEINGKLYKRLFNYSTSSWVGDWILVG